MPIRLDHDLAAQGEGSGDIPPPTKVFEDRVASGGAGIAAITLDGVIASEGGIPIVVGGKIVGAMGCSGGTGQQDGQACQAGVNAVK